MYAVPTTYYDVLSDFLIAHPDSPIFAGKAKEVFWGDGEEEYYFNFAFVARLLNNSFKSKYNLNIDTQNFSNKPLDSKAEGSRPTEKTTYSFVRTDLKGDVDTFDQSHYGDQNDLWKHEIGSSYSSENVEKVRRWVKGYKSMNGESVTDPFNNKPTSEITQQEYIEAVFNNVFNFYLSTFKDQLEPEQIKELRAKFGDSVFNIVGNSVGADIDNPETYVVNGGGSHIFRNSLGVVTENTETFSYHDVVTPLRAYRLTASNNLVRHIYEQVNKQANRGSVIATHKDTKGKELAPAEKIVTDVPDGESYTTNEKSFPNKSVIERQPDGSVRIRITGYRLTKTPENKNGRVKGGSVITVPYVYEEVEIANIENKPAVKRGSVIVTHKDTEGNELVPTEQIVTDVPDGTSYTTSSKEIPSKVVTDETPEGFTRTTTTTYELVENPANKDGQVKGGSVITVPYVYKKVVKQEINGSVIVTHYDEDGNQLAPDEKIKDNAKSGEHYTSSPKHFDSTNITANANGLTQRIYSGYELVRTPANNSGEVEGGKTIIVPYVYRKVSSIILHGSVIATHKDTEGHELAPAEQIKTNVPGGESYSTNEKSFPNQSVVERRPDGSVRIQVIGYKLVKTPENKDGKVKGGSVITVPYVYEKVVIANIENKPVDKPKSEIPKDAPKVDIEAVKLTRFMLEDRKTEIKPHVEGFVEPIEKIGNYAYTGVTDSDEGGAVVTHIYKSVKAFELPKDAPVHDKPEYNGGAVPNEAPVHDKPEYNGGAVPNDAPVHDKPEFNGGVIPNDAPVHDKPEFNGGVIPNDAPVHDKPEYNGGAVPNDAPVHDKPEFNGDAVPNEAPVHDKPEFNGNVSRIDSTAHGKPELKIPAQSVETPVAEVEKPSQPAAQKPQEKYATKELPNTGSEASVLGLVGLATAIGSIGLLKFKKDDSE